MAWAVGAQGKEGVAKAIEILGKELDTTMALCGVTSIKAINRNVIERETIPVNGALKPVAKALKKAPAKTAKRKR
jgi:hypothetical protein